MTGYRISTGRDADIRHEAAMTFEEWRKEAEQILMAWHNDDPACGDKDHWRQCFDHNYRPWEAARYAAELLRQRATAPPRRLRSADGGPLFPADDLGCETTSPRVSQFCALLLRRSQVFLKLLPWRSNRHTALAIRSIQMEFSAHKEPRGPALLRK